MEWLTMRSCEIMVGSLKTGLLASALLTLAIPSANATGDAARGRALFVQCAACHTAQKGAQNRVGPNLFGVVGRKAGTLPGYSYSSAMMKSGIVWGPNTLPRYLMGPSKVVPGTKMTFAGFSNQQQANDVAAYLATLK
jgi:cytochrome c